MSEQDVAARIVKLLERVIWSVDYSYDGDDRISSEINNKVSWALGRVVEEIRDEFDVPRA